MRKLINEKHVVNAIGVFYFLYSVASLLFALGIGMSGPSNGTFNEALMRQIFWIIPLWLGAAAIGLFLKEYWGKVLGILAPLAILAWMFVWTGFGWLTEPLFMPFVWPFVGALYYLNKPTVGALFEYKKI